MLWSANVTGPVGAGHLEGSFGVYDVDHVGQAFLIPKDGSTTVVASGFGNGLTNGDLSGFTGGPLAFLLIQFTSLSPYEVRIVNFSSPGATNAFDWTYFAGQGESCPGTGFQQCFVLVGMFGTTQMMLGGLSSSGTFLLSGGSIEWTLVPVAPSISASSAFWRTALASALLALGATWRQRAA